MPTLKETRENLKTISLIKSIVNTYHEVANLRMKQIRGKVLRNREFFKHLLEVYQKAKSSYLKKGKEEKEGVKETKKEKVVIFLSANHLFYGPLISDIWKKILLYLKEEKADLAIIGRMGKYLAEAAGFGHIIFYFELNDDKPEEKNIAGIIEFIKNYKKIIVFYGRYKTVLSQEAVLSEISELPFEKTKGKVKKYLFEPSPEEVLNFFETEIMATLFNQCILEHQLARYASRVIAMYRATENAKTLEKKLNQIENKLIKQIINKKQIELFSYFNL